jgi:hypothetical protein
MSQPSVYHSDISMGMSRGNNVGEYHFDRNMSRDPENVITIFTVNTRPQYSASGGVTFAGRAANERCRKVGSISDPKYYVDNVSIEGSKDQRKVTADDGKWVAMDWLNPENVFNQDQDYTVPNQVDYSTDLLRRGLFFIVRPFNSVTGNVDDQPTEQELAAAEKRMRDRYTALVRLYQTTSAASPAKLPQILNEEMIDALNFARLKTPYNTTLSEMTDCPTCGESIPAGVRFHKSESLGVICINPSVEGWKAAVNAGIKGRDDVPEEFRWAGRTPNPR